MLNFNWNYLNCKKMLLNLCWCFFLPRVAVISLVLTTTTWQLNAYSVTSMPKKKSQAWKSSASYYFLAFEAENAANEVDEEIIRMSVRSFSSASPLNRHSRKWRLHFSPKNIQEDFIARDDARGWQNAL